MREDIRSFLLDVQKPGRYTGGETNSVYKDLDKVNMRVAFCFPEMCIRDRDKLTVSRARKVQRFMSQALHVAEAFNGFAGKYVTRKETIRGFKEIIEGKCDNLPESAFLFIGSIDEAYEKAKLASKD